MENNNKNFTLFTSATTHVMDGNFARVCKFNRMSSTPNASNLIYVPVTLEFVNRILKENQITTLIARSDIDSIMLSGMYFPIVNDEIAGFMLPLTSMVNNNPTHDILFVNKVGRILGATIPRTNVNMATLTSVQAIEQVLSTIDIETYSNHFKKLKNTKSYTSMYAFKGYFKTLNDSFLDSRLEDIE